MANLFRRLFRCWFGVPQVHPLLDQRMSVNVGDLASNDAAFEQLKVDSVSRFSVVDGHFPAKLHKRRSHGLNPIAARRQTGQAIDSVRISAGFKPAV